MICFRGLTHHDISFSGTAAAGYLLLEKILNKIKLPAITNGENKGSSREIKVLTNISMPITKDILGYPLSSSQDDEVVPFALSSTLSLGERRVTGQ